MQNSILILTSAGDIHAYAVAEALRRKGASPVLWHTSDFPSRAGESIYLDDVATHRVVTGSLDLTDPPFKTVWRRRPAHIVDQEKLHAADREFAQQECSAFRRCLLLLLAPDSFWINPTQAAIHASSKLLQLAIASRAGFKIPATLASNDPEQVKGFMRQRGGRIVFKTFSGGAWEDEASIWMPFTALLTEENLVSDDLLRLSPGIFQEEVPKAFELRVTVMGRCAMASKILSQQTQAGRLDWRRSYGELKFEPFDLKPEIAELCFRVLSDLGLVFGCLDLVVTPRGEYVFLEVNEMGQFLFIEQATGLPLLDAFSEFLIAGRPGFEGSTAVQPVQYADVKDVANEEAKKALELHLEYRPVSFWEGVQS